MSLSECIALKTMLAASIGCEPFWAMGLTGDFSFSFFTSFCKQSTYYLCNLKIQCTIKLSLFFFKETKRESGREGGHS